MSIRMLVCLSLLLKAVVCQIAIPTVNSTAGQPLVYGLPPGSNACLSKDISSTVTVGANTFTACNVNVNVTQGGSFQLENGVTFLTGSNVQVTNVQLQVTSGSSISIYPSASVNFVQNQPQSPAGEVSITVYSSLTISPYSSVSVGGTFIVTNYATAELGTSTVINIYPGSNVRATGADLNIGAGSSFTVGSSSNPSSLSFYSPIIVGTSASLTVTPGTHCNIMMPLSVPNNFKYILNSHSSANGIYCFEGLKEKEADLKKRSNEISKIVSPKMKKNNDLIRKRRSARVAWQFDCLAINSTVSQGMGAAWSMCANPPLGYLDKDMTSNVLVSQSYTQSGNIYVSNYSSYTVGSNLNSGNTYAGNVFLNNGRFLIQSQYSSGAVFTMSQSSQMTINQGAFELSASPYYAAYFYMGAGSTLAIGTTKGLIGKPGVYITSAYTSSGSYYPYLYMSSYATLICNGAIYMSTMYPSGNNPVYLYLNTYNTLNLGVGSRLSLAGGYLYSSYSNVTVTLTPGSSLTLAGSYGQLSFSQGTNLTVYDHCFVTYPFTLGSSSYIFSAVSVPNAYVTCIPQ